MRNLAGAFEAATIDDPQPATSRVSDTHEDLGTTPIEEGISSAHAISRSSGTSTDIENYFLRQQIEDLEKKLKSYA